MLIVICEIDFLVRIFSRFLLTSSPRAQGSTFETKIGHQIEDKICHGNISQITTSPGLIVICEIDFLFRIFCRFLQISSPRAQGSTFETKIGHQIEHKICLGNISQITTSPGLIVICGIDFLFRIFCRFLLISSPRAQGSTFETKIGHQIEHEICLGNISQITTSPGLIVICEIAFLFRNFCRFLLISSPRAQGSTFETKIGHQIEHKICHGNILQITTSPGLIVICEIDFLFRIFCRFLLISSPRAQGSTFETKIGN